MSITCIIRYEIDPFQRSAFAEYEAYRARLKADPEGRANFAMAQSQRFILHEERNFVENVEGTIGVPAGTGGETS